MRRLPDTIARLDDVEARTRTLRGAWLAGWALGSTTMGLHHKLAHVLGGRYQLPHAGVPGPESVGPALFELTARLRAPTSLADLGLHHTSIREVAKIIDANPVANPRDYSEEDVVLLLEQAYLGTRPMPERN